MKLFWCLVAFLSGADCSELMHLAKSLSSVGSCVWEGWKSTMPSNKPGSAFLLFFFPLPLQCTRYFGTPWPSTASVLLHRDRGRLADCRHLCAMWAVSVEHGFQSTAEHPSQENFLALNQTGMTLPYISPVTCSVPEVNETALCTYWHKGLNKRPPCWLV